MLEIGQVFNKDNSELCIIDIVELEGVKYALFEKRNKVIIYSFYMIQETESGVNLYEIKDDDLNNRLLELIDNDEVNYGI